VVGGVEGFVVDWCLSDIVVVVVVVVVGRLLWIEKRQNEYVSRCIESI